MTADGVMTTIFAPPKTSDAPPILTASVADAIRLSPASAMEYDPLVTGDVDVYRRLARTATASPDATTTTVTLDQTGPGGREGRTMTVRVRRADWMPVSGIDSQWQLVNGKRRVFARHALKYLVAEVVAGAKVPAGAFSTDVPAGIPYTVNRHLAPGEAAAQTDPPIYDLGTRWRSYVLTGQPLVEARHGTFPSNGALFRGMRRPTYPPDYGDGPLGSVDATHVMLGYSGPALRTLRITSYVPMDVSRIAEAVGNVAPAGTVATRTVSGGRAVVLKRGYLGYAGGAFWSGDGPLQASGMAPGWQMVTRDTVYVQLPDATAVIEGFNVDEKTMWDAADAVRRLGARR